MAAVPESETSKSAITAAVADGDFARLECLVSVASLEEIDLPDEHGMTPLQHAAYKGDERAVKLLLDRGADVNSGKHEHGYTALHFGALSGNANVCQMLMDAGVDVAAKNSVGRTAAQMAAFVGNRRAVAKINNHIPRSSVDRFVAPMAKNPETAPPQDFAERLHEFVAEVNLNPVGVCLNLHRSPSLVDNLTSVVEVLESMRDKEMNGGGDNDEVVAFKLHYLSYVAGEILLAKNKQTEKKTDVVESFAKRLLKPGKDGITPEYRDGFLKEGIRKFPFRQSLIFRQTVSALTRKDAPSAIGAIESAINGHPGFANGVPRCDTCGEEKPAKKCSKCKSVQYCDRECQRLHWFVHKKACARATSVPMSSHEPPSPRVDVDELGRHLQDLATS